MKKHICIFLAVAMVVTLFGVMPVSAETSGTCGENITWVLDDNGTLTISGEGNIEDSHDWDNVSENVKTVIIENGITSIDSYLFKGWHEITNVTIPDSVTSIGDYAFSYAEKLTNIKISDNIKHIGYMAFGGTAYSGDANNWNDGILYIGDIILDVETNVSQIAIKYGTKTIADRAFAGCKSLTLVTIPDTVTNIDHAAFISCSSISNIVIPNSVNYIGDYAFGYCDGLTNIVIPEGVPKIGTQTFYACDKLKNVTIPKSVMSIEAYAFDGCNALSEINYTGTCEQWKAINIASYNTPISQATIKCTDGIVHDTIPNGTCGENVTWVLDDDGTLTISGEGKMDDYYNNSPWYNYKSSIKSVIISESVTSIGSYAFDSCGELTSIEIPNSVTDIGDSALASTGLTNITMSDNITHIGYMAFYNSAYYGDYNNWDNGILYIGNSLVATDTNEISSQITIKEGTKTIADLAFMDNGLTSVVVPDSVINIGRGAFAFCGNLTSVRLSENITSIAMQTFKNCTNLTDIIIPDKVTSIGEWAFANCGGLTSVIIPDSVTSIGNEAFIDCSFIESLTIGSDTTSVGDGAFQNCESLTDIYYNGTKNQWDSIVIGKDNDCFINAKIHCSDDEVYETPKELTYVIHDDYVEITGCTGMPTEIEIPSQIENLPVTSIGNSAFSGNDYIKLTSVKLPDSIKNIGVWAFSGSGITDITIPDGVESIGGYCFYNCFKLKSVALPDTIKSIGNSAFYYCNSLTDIEIPDSVTSIGSRAFYGCGNLTSISIPDNVTTVSEYMFYNCSNLTRVNLGSSVKEIATYAFYGCDSLTDVYYNDTFAKFQEVYIDNGFNNTNKPFIQATKHYVSDTPVPTDPTDTNSVIVMVEPVQGMAGSEVTVPIRIKNNPGISSFSFKISYNTEQLVPRGITKNADMPGSLTSNIEQSDDYASLEYVTAVWSNASDYSADGELFYITFDLYPTASKGEYIPVSISATGNIINQAYEEITATMKNGSVAIDFIYGDMYGDGVLDNKDLVRMRQYLADWDITLTDEEKKAADVYADGIINNKDLVLLSQYFAEWNVTLGR